MTKYSIPSLTRKMASMGHRLTPQNLRNRLLRASPPELTQLSNGRYVIEVLNEQGLLDLTYRLTQDTGYWQE